MSDRIKIYSLVGAFLVFLFVMVGFTDNYHNVKKQEQQLAAEIIEQTMGRRTSIKSVSRTEADKDFVAESQKFADEEYTYYINLSDEYIVAIHPIGSDFNYQDNKTVNAEEVYEKALSLVTNNNVLARGFVVDYRVYENEGLGFTVELIEKYEEYESGTKASLSYDYDGKLISAAFLKGNPDIISVIENSKMLTEKECITIAVEELQRELDRVDFDETSFVQSKLKTHNSVIYRSIELLIESPDGESNRYWIDINSITGELLEIEYEL